jgi:hypothetical protein
MEEEGIPEGVQNKLQDLFDDLKNACGTDISLDFSDINLDHIHAAIDSYDKLISILSNWASPRFLILIDLNGVLGYRVNTQKFSEYPSVKVQGLVQGKGKGKGKGKCKEKDKNREQQITVTKDGLVKRPNIGFFLQELDKLDYEGVQKLVYTSARQKNIEPHLKYIDSSHTCCFDQTFCFIRTLKTKFINTLINYDDINIIIMIINGFIYDQHIDIRQGIAENNRQLVINAIYSINIVLQLFMMKGSKNLKNIRKFIHVCQEKGQEKGQEKSQEKGQEKGQEKSQEKSQDKDNDEGQKRKGPMTIVLIDDEIQEKLPVSEIMNGFSISSYNEISAKTFNVHDDTLKIREMIKNIENRIYQNYLLQNHAFKC